jgi:hypothetical protein
MTCQLQIDDALIGRGKFCSSCASAKKFNKLKESYLDTGPVSGK